MCRLISWQTPLVVLLVAAIGGQPTQASDPGATVEHAVIGGIALDIGLTTAGGEASPVAAAADNSNALRAGDTLRLRIGLRDEASSTPLAGAEPAAWMDRRHGGEAPECGEQVARYLTGDIFSKADIDWNVYYIVTMNHDATLSIVDPLFGFGGSRTLAVIPLQSPGSDWQLARGERLFVSQPEVGRVAVIRTDTWEIVEQIDVGRGVARLRLQGDGAFLWAHHDEGLTVIDVASGSVVERIELDVSDMSDDGADDVAGGWAFDFVFDHEDRRAYVLTHHGVAAVDVHRRTVVGRVALDGGPVSIVWSELGGAAWIAHEDGTLSAVDWSQGELRLRQQTRAAGPLVGLWFAPDGRLGFALSLETNTLAILDAARGRILKSGPMAGAPDQVVFSSELAYVRDRRSEQVLMVPLDTAGAVGEPIQAADFPGGLRPMGHRPEDPPVLASSFARAPGANAMVVANAEDSAIYFYMEGMAAPMGHFTTQGRRPLAVTVIDRSLQERGTGVYESFARLDEPGLYDVAVFLDTPRLVHCFSVEVSASHGPTQPRAPRVRLVEGSTRRSPSGGVELEVERTADEDGDQAPTELTLRVQRVAGGWHRSVVAERIFVGPSGPMRYRATIDPSKPGDYLVWADSMSSEIAAQPLVHLRVLPREARRGATR